MAGVHCCSGSLVRIRAVIGSVVRVSLFSLGYNLVDPTATALVSLTAGAPIALAMRGPVCGACEIFRSWNVQFASSRLS